MPSGPSMQDVGVIEITECTGSDELLLLSCYDAVLANGTRL